MTNEYQLISQLNERQKDDLLALFKNEFWCKDRKREDLDKVLANSDIVVGLENRDGRLIGFCRLLTDYIYKTVIYDVIIDPAFRGRMLGRILMDAIIQHPDLREVGQFDLNCLPHMREFYRRWGFTDDLGDLVFMRRHNKLC